MLLEGLPVPKEKTLRVSKSRAGTETVEIPGLMRLYKKTLEDRGYRSSALRGYIRAAEHFIAWSEPKADRLTIGEATIKHFVEKHLDECDCLGRPQRRKVTAWAALRRLLGIVRDSGLVAPRASKLPNHIECEASAFCTHLSEVHGLAPATLISRRQWVSRFLTHHFPINDIKLSQLTPEKIRNFFTICCQGFRPGTAQVVASAIRSYLRFRAVRHADPVEALIAAIPLAAHWRLAALPDYLDAAEVTKLMLAFDHERPQSQRDYAIVRCLVDLGLRSCEVAALRLDDIDWKSGTLTIRAGKALRADVLPLPAVTGQAVAEYLRKARPAATSRAVFVRHRAPLQTPINASVIRSVVRQAAVRSGLCDRLRGPHMLRHSAATRMLHGGATLKEIADVLRHRSLDTTAIYAKVDIARLNAIAQHWPGGAA